MEKRTRKTVEEAAKHYCDVHFGDKSKMTAARSIESWDDAYYAFIAGYKVKLSSKQLSETPVK